MVSVLTSSKAFKTALQPPSHSVSCPFQHDKGYPPDSFPAKIVPVARAVGDDTVLSNFSGVKSKLFRKYR